MELQITKTEKQQIFKLLRFKQAKKIKTKNFYLIANKFLFKPAGISDPDASNGIGINTSVTTWEVETKPTVKYIPNEPIHNSNSISLTNYLELCKYLKSIGVNTIDDAINITELGLKVVKCSNIEIYYYLPTLIIDIITALRYDKEKYINMLHITKIDYNDLNKQME